MTNNFSDPRNIYAEVESKINEVLHSLNVSNQQKSLEDEFKKAREILDPHAEKLKREIRSLEENSEWNTFVMAFYGETNAGKSTIIESLRILLKEESKAIAQEKFRSLQEQFNLTEQRFSELRAAIVAAEERARICKEHLVEAEKKKVDIESKDKAAFETLNERIKHLKKTASLWQKVIMLFKKIPEIRELEILEQRMSNNQLITDKEISAAKEQLNQSEVSKTVAMTELDKAEIEKKNLSEFADGAIIGDGKSDFTIKTQEYRFSAHGQEFVLLDVPGIEGDEGKVIDSVNNAVKKAHAVFYVTGKAAPPQRGENGQKGTLEKIKEHLNAQTEVWSIYNKRITNPIQIENGLLISIDEKKSLDDLDEKMSEQLERNYKGTISLSAYPAFLAAAKYLVPGSHHLNAKEKFSKKFNGKEILEKTKMNGFYQFIARDLVRNAKSKILQSNFTKAKCIVNDTNGAISHILDSSMIPLREKLTRDADSTKEQLEMALNSLKSRIMSAGDRATDNFIETVRQRMYSAIDSDINNDDFKYKFESTIRNEQSSLTANLPEQIKTETKKFQSQISGILERYKELAEDTIDAYNHVKIEGMDMRLDLDIDIKNGVNVPGLIVTAIGGALMIWNPSGWFVLALGAISIFVNVVKAIRSFFSSDYKKSQQRESVNNNLSKIKSNMRESMQASLDDTFIALDTKLNRINSVVDKPVMQISMLVNILSQTKNHFLEIVKDIDSHLEVEDEKNIATFAKMA